jgi:hypothetical protein
MQCPHGNRHVSVFDLEKLDCMGQDLVAERQHRQDAKFPGALPCLEIGSQALHFIELGKQPFNVRVQRERFGSRRQPALAALEKGKTQLQLGMLQDAADSRLGDIDQAGRPADAAGEHDRVENFDVAQAHGWFRGACSGGMVQVQHSNYRAQHVRVIQSRKTPIAPVTRRDLSRVSQ